MMYDNTTSFEYYGAWSPAVFGAGLPTQAQLDRILQVRGGIHMGTGIQDYLINIGPNSIARAQALRDLGVDVTSYDLPGVHSWDIWRQLLDNFIQGTMFRTTDIGVTNTGRSFTATVSTVTTEPATPTGTVVFTFNGEPIGKPQPMKNGTAQIAVPASLGSGTLGFVYSGDQFYNSSDGSVEVTSPVR